MAAHNAEVQHNMRYAGFKRTVADIIKKQGLRIAQLQLEYLQTHPAAKLPKEYFTINEIIQAYKDAIADYTQSQLANE